MKKKIKESISHLKPRSEKELEDNNYTFMNSVVEIVEKIYPEWEEDLYAYNNDNSTEYNDLLSFISNEFYNFFGDPESFAIDVVIAALHESNSDEEFDSEEYYGKLDEGYGSAFSGGAGYAAGGGSRGGGFGGASNMGGPNMMYTYEIKPLNHSLEPIPNNTSDQLQQIHIGCKVIAEPIKSNNIQYEKEITGTLQSVKLAEDGAVKYYVVFDEATATAVKVDPTTIKIIVEEPIKYFADEGPETPSRRREKMEKITQARRRVSESFDVFLKKTNEGVGDKYAAKKWFIPDEEEEFEKKFQKHKLSTRSSDKLVGTITHSSISKDKKFKEPVDVYKNPDSFTGFQPGIRGVIMPNGDLYMAESVEVIHYDILELMAEKGIIPQGTQRGWEELDTDEFLTVQRVGGLDIIGIGESYVFPKVLKRHTEEEKEANKKEQKRILKICIPFLQAAEKKNSQFKFPAEQMMSLLRKLVPREQRARIFESIKEPIIERYDSPDTPIIPPDEVRQMVKMEPYKNKFQYGAWHGQGSANLNKAIGDILLYSKDKDAYGIIEVLFKTLVDKIPALKGYEVDERGTDSRTHNLFLKKEVPIGKDLNLEDEYSVKIHLWLQYHVKGDEILDYKKGRIRLLFSPQITTSRTSIGLDDIIKKSDVTPLPSGEITDEITKNYIKAISKLLSGQPDKEDEYQNENNKIFYRNLQINTFPKAIARVDKNLKEFSKYVKTKYNVDL